MLSGFAEARGRDFDFYFDFKLIIDVGSREATVVREGDSIGVVLFALPEIVYGPSLFLCAEKVGLKSSYLSVKFLD